MRLIDADALYMELVKMKDFGELTAKKAIRVVKNAPTIDAEPVRHGKWINANEGRWNTCEVLKCSECGELDNRMYKTDKYCPNCGARMDK